MKTLLILLTILYFNFSFGQIGIGTPSPNGALDITSTNDGLLIPRLNLSATNVATIITPTISELVYNLFTSAAGPNQVTPGFYYWTGSSWSRVGTGNNTEWSLTGNNGIVPGTNFIGTINAVDLRIKTGNADRFDFTSNGRLRSYDNGTTGLPTYSWNGDTDTGFWRPAADNLGFSTSGLERMRINQNGQVSINNITPFVVDRFSVYNTTTSDYAINGYSTATGTGVYGENNGTGIGVYGRNTSGNGVLGITGGSTGAGVFGAGDANLGAGVYGRSTGTNGTGVIGFANNTGGDGVIGLATQANRFGVLGINDNATGIGVYGTSTAGIGVRGFSTNQYGVYGTSASATSFGMLGTNTNATGTGIVGAGNGLTASYLVSGSGGAFTGNPNGVIAWGSIAASGNGFVGAGNNQTISTFAQGSGGTFTGLQWGIGGISTISGVPNNGTNRAAFIGNYVSAGSTSETIYVGARIGGVHYKILGSGGASVSTTMSTSQGERILFAPESPENWFFDIGEIVLINGKAKVFLDPILIECISDAKPFKVFVQGAENTLGTIKITRNQKEKYFEIEDLGGQSNGSVMYNIYALWKGKENLRFPELKPEDKIQSQQQQSEKIALIDEIQKELPKTKEKLKEKTIPIDIKSELKLKN